MNDISLRPVSHSRLHQDLVIQLRELIISEHLQPGDRLPSERRLAEMCGVSRPIVREALCILERDGVVRVKAGSGAYVAQPDAAAVIEPLSFFLQTRKISLENLLELRRLLEPEIARQAAERRRPTHLAAMDAAIGRMEQTLGDAASYIVADQEFHAALADATNNPLYSIILEPIADLMKEVRLLTEGVPGSSERSQAIHRLILHHVHRRHPLAARQAMLQHMQEKEEEIHQVLAQGGPKKGCVNDHLP